MKRSIFLNNILQELVCTTIMNYFVVKLTLDFIINEVQVDMFAVWYWVSFFSTTSTNIYGLEAYVTVLKAVSK